ncbi:MAG: hypothetical protein QOD86_2674 [Miltoncostaeaceae bacterium]|nr:hypothetical protein [Miltoncostaeaceae bacterium]
MPAAELPRIAEDARFVRPERLAGAPHVVVDGPRMPGTVLALSHWRGSGTPPELAADTSAAIADRYLDAGAAGPPVDALTNNHYDEDGLFAIWLLLERPARDAPARRLAVAAGEAGDFATWTDPAAAWCAIAAMALAEPVTSPLPAARAAVAAADGRDPAGALYEAVLPEVGPLLDDPERHRPLWGPRWAAVEADMALLDAGEATIEEAPEADVAIVRGPRPLVPLAVHPRTERMRVLTVTGDGLLVLTHRYETWVDYVSRPLAARVDLAPLLPRLQAIEEEPVTWRFEGVEPITPRLFPVGPNRRIARSGIPPERLVAELTAVLEAAGAAGPGR